MAMERGEEEEEEENGWAFVFDSVILSGSGVRVGCCCGCYIIRLNTYYPVQSTVTHIYMHFHLN